MSQAGADRTRRRGSHATADRTSRTPRVSQAGADRTRHRGSHATADRTSRTPRVSQAGADRTRRRGSHATADRTSRKPRLSQAVADRVAREAGGLTAADFARIIKIGEAASMLPRPEAKAACAAIGPLTPAQKKFLIRGLCARSENDERTRGYGDLVAWTIVEGCIGPREPLPFDRSDVHYVLVHVRSRVDVLPPKLVARIVERYVKEHGPLDRDLVAKVKAAATVLAGNIGSGFIDAAAKLRALI